MDFKKRIGAYIILLGLLSAALTLVYHDLRKKAISVFCPPPPLVFSTGTFSSVMEKEFSAGGLSGPDLRGVVKAFSKKLDFRRLSARDSYLLAFSSEGFKYVTVFKDQSEYSVFRKNGGYIFSRAETALKSETFEVSGDIKDSLWDSLSRKDVPAELILDFTDIFSWSVDFLTESRNGDKFKVFYELQTDKRGRIVSKKIKAAMYDGQETGRKIAVEYGGRYYNEKGEGAKGMFLRAPLNYRRISSYFTYKRFHPVLKYVRPHLGIDYAAATGTPVSSVADGVVVYKGRKGGFGNFVEIKHSSGYVTTYGHLSRYAGIRVGKKVRQGDVIGYVGMTGIATGPHLDFRIKHNGQLLNYLKIKQKASSDIPSRARKEFLGKVKSFFPAL